MKSKYRTVSEALMLAFKAFICALWTTTAVTAYAAIRSANEFGSGIVLDPMVVALTCVISTLSGATALAWRINDLMLKEDERVATEGGDRRRFVRPWLFAGAHMGGSWMGGVLAFLIGKGNAWDVWNVLGFVLAMSFIGSKGIEMVAERWLGSVKLPIGPKGDGK